MKRKQTLKVEQRKNHFEGCLIRSRNRLLFYSFYGVFHQHCSACYRETARDECCFTGMGSECIFTGFIHDSCTCWQNCRSCRQEESLSDRCFGFYCGYHLMRIILYREHAYFIPCITGFGKCYDVYYFARTGSFSLP